MPDIPAEQNRSFQHIWQTFTKLDLLEDGRHDSEAWTRRAGEFVMCCVRIPAEAFAPEIADIRSALAEKSYARVHPPDFLHIAVQELGFVTKKSSRRDEFTQARLDEFLTYIDRPIGDFNPFIIRLGGINSFADAPFIEVRDNGWLSRIHLRLRDFVIVPPNKHFPYLPFATIAHYADRVSAADAIELITPFHDVPLGSFQVNEIDIVRLRVNEPYPPLEVVHTIKLGLHHLEAPIRPLPIEPLDDHV
jgi:2'-5' RNA ligase